MSTDREREKITELVLKLQSGDSGAFGELYKLTSGRAYFVAFEITKNEQDAEDVLQESYIKMLEKIGTLDKPESFVSWFHHMVANKSKDSLKKRKPTLFEGGEDEAFEVIPDEDTSFTPEANLDQEELHRAVIEVIDELTEEKRACVMMMYFEEMSVNEISESLEIPVSTVKNRLFTARKDMKAKFEKRGITSLYSTAPIGLVIWAFSKTADAMSKSFAQSAASAKVLSGITVSGAAGGAAATATAAAATTAAGTGTAAAGTGTAAAGAGPGVAAKVAALTVTQKVVAGVVITGIVGGSAATAAVVSNNNKEEPLVTTAIVEEVTTAPIFETEFAVSVFAVTEITTEETEVAESTTDEETTSRKETSAVTATTAKETETAKPSTTQKEKTTRVRTTRTTKAATTEVVTTEEETTTEPTTTRKETTTKAATTKKATTAAPTTTKAATTKPTTTAAPTTTAVQKATVTVSVIDFDDSVADTLTIEVDAGTVLSHETLFTLVEGKGYTITSGFDGSGYNAETEAGGSYAINAYL